MNLPCTLQKTKGHSGFKGHRAEKTAVTPYCTQIKRIPLECTELDSAASTQAKFAEISHR